MIKIKKYIFAFDKQEENIHETQHQPNITHQINGRSNLRLKEINLVMKRYLLIAIIFMLLSACSNDDDAGRGPVYVKPSVDYKGKYRKGHLRMPVSTKKDAVKSQSRSRYYYQTRGKYRRKKK